MPISGCHDLPLATFNLPSAFPSRLSPRRMSGTTVGRILSHAREWNENIRNLPRQRVGTPPASRNRPHE